MCRSSINKFTFLYFFLVSGIFAQSITIQIPNGGEIWRNGTSHNIVWTNTGSISNVNIEYYNGSTWINIPGAQNISNTGSYNWLVPNTSTSRAKIRVSNAANPSIRDESNSDFRILFPNITSNPVIIMPLGNSITYDTRSNDTRPNGQKTAYRFMLWDLLRADNYSVDFTGTQSTGFEVFPDPQNEGHPGWRDDEIAANVYSWLQASPNTNIILLHIGTNAVDTSRADVQNILNEIDRFESSNNKQIWVVLSKIIDRSPHSEITSTFNNNVQQMAIQRIINGDRIIMVDMEDGAGINYNITTVPPYANGDMYDALHPNPGGYNKMGILWYEILKLLLPAPTPSAPAITSNPVATAGLNQLYNYDVNASGVGAPLYNLVSAPSGMTINQNTGMISWIPNSLGDYSATVRAANSSGMDQQFFTVTVWNNPCPADMVSYWKLDEAVSGIYYDFVGSNNATGIVSPTPVSGIVNGAQQFNGSTSKIDVPANPAFDFASDDNFTIEFWYKGSNIPSTVKSAVGRNISSQARWWVGLNANDGRARFYMSGGGTSIALNGTVITNGNWHHVAVTRNGTTGATRLYVDGILRSSTTKKLNTAFSSSTTNLNIGWFSFQSAYAIQGILDEVAIHRIELGSSTIQGHYNDGLAGIGFCGSPSQTAPVITSTPVTSASVAQSYSYDVNASGSPSPSFSLTTFPSGMSINSTTGLIQWTPSSTGNYNVTVRAVNGINPAASQSYTISVSGSAAPIITSTPVTSGFVGQNYVYDVNATGTPSPTYSLTTFPGGMSISSNTGIINWQPSTIGNYNVTVQAGNGINPAAQQSYVITVNETAPSCPPGLISYWNFNENSGNTYSDMTGLNNATAGTTAPVPVSGKLGRAQQFNGSTTGINVPANSSFDFAANSSFSIEFWYQGSTLPSTVKTAVGRYIPNTGAKWWVGLNANDGRARFYLSAGGSSAAVNGTVITDGNWHHVVATRNGLTGAIKLYVDGLLRSSTTKIFSSGFSSPSANLNIGWYSFQSVYSLNGKLDEVAIHNIELSASAVQQHYNNVIAGIDYCNQSGLAKSASIDSPFKGFRYYLENRNVRLLWHISAEYLTGFEVEKSFSTKYDSEKIWETIKFVGPSDGYKYFEYTDQSIKSDGQYSYRIKFIDTDGLYTYSEELDVTFVPTTYNLYQNYPNPFNPITTIRFSIPQDQKVVIKIYNQLGEEVIELLNEDFAPGTYETIFNAGSLPSGVYFYRMEAGKYSSVKKLLLLK